jgi:ubiquitin thioesterase protein OTUB1
MNKECDQLSVMALASAFGLRVTIEYLDRSEGDRTNQFTFPIDYDGPDAGIYILYRPGHYDVLYKAE